MRATARRIGQFLRDEQGLESVEWAIVSGLIVVAAAALWTTIGDNVKTQIDGLEAAVPDTAPVGGGS